MTSISINPLAVRSATQVQINEIKLIPGRCFAVSVGLADGDTVIQQRDLVIDGADFQSARSGSETDLEDAVLRKLGASRVPSPTPQAAAPIETLPRDASGWPHVG